MSSSVALQQKAGGTLPPQSAPPSKPIPPTPQPTPKPTTPTPQPKPAPSTPYQTTAQHTYTPQQQATPPQPKPNTGNALISLLTNPIGFVENIFPALKIGAEHTPGALGVYAQGTVGSVGTVLNQKVAVTNFVGGIAGQKPDTFKFKATTPVEQIGGYAAQGTEIAAVTLLTGGEGLLGGAAYVGTNEAITVATKGKFETNPTDILNDFIVGEATEGIFEGANSGVTALAGSEIPVLSRAAQITADLGGKISSKLVDAPIVGRVIGGIGGVTEKLDTAIPSVFSSNFPTESIGEFTPWKGNGATNPITNVTPINNEYVNQLISVTAHTVETDPFISPTPKGEFINGLESDVGFPKQQQNISLISKPNLGNLDIGSELHIRDPTINIDVANEKMDALLNEVPQKGSYDNFQIKMANGNVTTLNNLDLQLLNLDNLINEPLPRTLESQTIEEINQKIDSFGFDSKTVEAKINNQIKEVASFNVDQANANMNKALQEAYLEKSQSSNFITNVETDKGYPSQIKNNYLIKQPTKSNLNLVDQLNIRNPNVNVFDANGKMDALLNEVPQKGSYSDYKSIMSEGRTLTATRTKTALDTQLSNIEKIANQPFDKPINPILGNSFRTTKPLVVPLTNSFRLIPQVNSSRLNQNVTQRMNTQIAGVDAQTLNLINSRVRPIKVSDISNKISAQINGGALGISVLQGQGQMQNIGQGQSEQLTVRQAQTLSVSQLLKQSTAIGINQDVLENQAQSLFYSSQDVSNKIKQRRNFVPSSLNSRKKLYPIFNGKQFLRSQDIFGLAKHRPTKKHERR